MSCGNRSASGQRPFAWRLPRPRDDAVVATYTVLYHDPLPLSAEDRMRFEAGHSVWVCRDDRYAFEVHAVSERGEPSIASAGEARYRLALATLAARHAFHVARREPRRSSAVYVRVTAAQIAARLADQLPGGPVNFGDVIHEFEVQPLVLL
jgi:hypothetical protein